MKKGKNAPQTHVVISNVQVGDLDANCESGKTKVIKRRTFRLTKKIVFLIQKQRANKRQSVEAKQQETN